MFSQSLAFPLTGVLKPVQEVTREDGRVTALRGRLAPTKGAAETNLKLTWLAEVSAATLLPCLHRCAWPIPTILHSRTCNRGKAGPEGCEAGHGLAAGATESRCCRGEPRGVPFSNHLHAVHSLVQSARYETESVCAAQVEDNRVPLQLVSLGPLISVKQPGPADEIFSLFNEQSVGL